MKYILKTALILAAVNSVNAGSIADAYNGLKNSTANKTLGEVSTKVMNASINTFNSVKTQAMPYLTQAGKNLSAQADKAFLYFTSYEFKKDGQRALAMIQTPAGKLVAAGTIATLATSYGLYKYFTKKSDRKN